MGLTFFIIGRFVAKQQKLNQELIRSNATMHETNELVETFNYHVSHDLKNVLNNQIVLSQMIQKYIEKNDYDKLQEISEKLLLISENGMDTVQQFLVMSKEGYQMQESTTLLDVQVELAKLLVKNGCEKRVDLRFTQVEFETLVIQEKVFETIFVQLLTNTIKYNTQKPSVEIKLIKTADGKIIEFKDNGIGIDLEKDANKIFVPFQRFANNTNSAGTGVGLFIVKKLIQANSGTISVRSKLGEGAVFTMFFPK